MVDPTPRPRLVVEPDEAQARTAAPLPKEGHHPASFVVDSVVSEPLRAVIELGARRAGRRGHRAAMVKDVESADGPWPGCSRR